MLQFDRFVLLQCDDHNRAIRWLAAPFLKMKWLCMPRRYSVVVRKSSNSFSSLCPGKRAISDKQLFIRNPEISHFKEDVRSSTSLSWTTRTDWTRWTCPVNAFKTSATTNDLLSARWLLNGPSGCAFTLSLHNVWGFLKLNNYKLSNYNSKFLSWWTAVLFHSELGRYFTVYSAQFKSTQIKSVLLYL